MQEYFLFCKNIFFIFNKKPHEQEDNPPSMRKTSQQIIQQECKSKIEKKTLRLPFRRFPTTISERGRRRRVTCPWGNRALDSMRFDPLPDWRTWMCQMPFDLRSDFTATATRLHPSTTPTFFPSGHRFAQVSASNTSIKHWIRRRFSGFSDDSDESDFQLAGY